MAVLKKWVRLSIDVNFTCQDQKDSFCNRLSEVEKLLTQPGSRPIDIFSPFDTLFDLVSSLPLPQPNLLKLLLLPLSHTQPPFLTPSPSPSHIPVFSAELW